MKNAGVYPGGKIVIVQERTVLNENARGLIWRSIKQSAEIVVLETMQNELRAVLDLRADLNISRVEFCSRLFVDMQVTEHTAQTSTSSQPPVSESVCYSSSTEVSESTTSSNIDWHGTVLFLVVSSC